MPPISLRAYVFALVAAFGGAVLFALLGTALLLWRRKLARKEAALALAGAVIAFTLAAILQLVGCCGSLEFVF